MTSRARSTCSPTAQPPPFGQFQAASGPPRPALTPASIAVDLDQHLYVLDGATGTIWVFDLGSRVAFRHVSLAAAATGLAGAGPAVLVAVADRGVPLLRLAARRAPVPVPVPPAALGAVGPDALPIAVACGGADRIWMLWRSPSGDSWAVPVADDRTSAALGPFPWASGIALDGDGNVVIAGPAGDDFRSFAPAGGVSAENPPLDARGYDGRGIARTPDGLIGYWTDGGFRLAVAARLVYASCGQVDVFELDAGDYQQRWGRVFVDACIPDGTSVRDRVRHRRRRAGDLRRERRQHPPGRPGQRRSGEPGRAARDPASGSGRPRAGARDDPSPPLPRGRP